MGGVSRQVLSNRAAQIGRGYIIVPTNIDRTKYISQSYRKEKVSIMLDDGGSPIFDCLISKNVLQEIKFPDSSDELGSCVVFVKEVFYDKPIIVGVLSKGDESQLLEENMFKKKVSSDDASVVITGRGDTGDLFIDVDSDVDSGGNIYINLRNSDSSAKFNVNCFGDMSLYSEGNLELKSTDTVNLKRTESNSDGEVTVAEVTLDGNGLVYEDNFNNKIEAKDSNINIYSDGEININSDDIISLFEGSEPLVKGDELLTQLTKAKTRIDDIIQIMIDAADSAASSASYAAYIKTEMDAISDEEDYSDINSEKSFTD
jgi:hypothetical protein